MANHLANCLSILTAQIATSDGPRSDKKNIFGSALWTHFKKKTNCLCQYSHALETFIPMEQHRYICVCIYIYLYIYTCIIIYTYVHVWGKDPRKEKSVQRPQPIKMVTTPLDISDDKLGFGSPRPLSFRRVYPIFQAQLWIGS